MLLIASMLTGCSGAGNAEQTAPETTAESVSDTTAAVTTEAEIKSDAPDGWLDVYFNGAYGNGVTDDTRFFQSDKPIAGYYFSKNKNCVVDAETLRRLVVSPVMGEGTVAWKGFTNKNGGQNPDPFNGKIPIPKLHDPFYLAMCMPSEGSTSMNRYNPGNLYPWEAKYRKVLAIGAIYRNTDYELPDDATITVCLGKISLILYTKEKGWFIGNQMATPAKPTTIYYLPWSLEKTVGTMKLADDRYKVVDGHAEITLTGWDLNGANARDKGATGSVLHYWGSNYMIPEGEEIEAVIAAYEVWIKEPEYEGKVVATIGADWRDASNTISQVFSGYNFAATTEKKLVIGHNLGPKRYDELMDADKVMELLGMSKDNPYQYYLD